MRLREYLTHTGMTPIQFAEWVGVSKQKVWAWLRGDRKPKLKEIERIDRITQGAIKPEDWLDRPPAVAIRMSGNFDNLILSHGRR